jgi:cyanophycinase
MTAGVQPLFLLADSQPLFWRHDSSALGAAFKRHAVRPSRAAYLGASNGDVREFYEIFEAAMAHFGVRDCHMVSSSFSREEQGFLESADIVLLAGGDVITGWQVFEATGMTSVIERRYREGATLVGVSAGAVQLGTHARMQTGAGHCEWFTTFGLCPFLVDVHDESAEWREIRAAVLTLGGTTEAFGIPAGGGLVYHADRSVEALGQHAYRFLASSGGIRREVVPPKSRDTVLPSNP